MDREKVIKGLEEIANDKWMKIHADWYVSVCRDALALIKEQEGTINELQNAYGYLQKQYFEAQDKLLKEQEAVKPKCKERMGGFIAGLCPTCGTALNNILNVKACGKCGQAVKWE